MQTKANTAARLRVENCVIQQVGNQLAQQKRMPQHQHGMLWRVVAQIYELGASGPYLVHCNFSPQLSEIHDFMAKFSSTVWLRPGL